MTARPLPVIVNATAGKGHDDAEMQAIAKAFEAAGVTIEIMPARVGSDIVKLAERAVKDGHPVIVGGGGDGTVNAVACAVAGTASALGVLPLGTLNHFAKDLGIPLDLDKAALIIAANHQVAIDVGEVNGRLFINNSSLGLYPGLVIIRENLRRREGRSKWLALFSATMKVLRRHPMLDVRLLLDGEKQDRRTPLVFIGNNEYKVEGFDIGSRERLDGGKLSMYLTRRHGRRGLLGLAARALVGKLHESGDFEALTAQEVTISTRHKSLAVATDGEVTVMKTPLAYAIRPGALRVVAPAPAPPGEPA
ncbi:MAG: diacylglycerol kinase family protein [Usitatibacter sp.]